jgi:hypothetical protein
MAHGVDPTGTRNPEEELFVALSGDVHGIDANGLDTVIPGRTVFPWWGVHECCLHHAICVDCTEKSPLCALSPEELAQIVTEVERERQHAEAVSKMMPEGDIAEAYRGMLGGW